MRHDASVSELPYESTQEMWCAREAMRFIDEGRTAEGEDEQPFCVQVAFQRPHHPLLPQQRFWDLYPADLALPETFDQDPSHRPPHFQRMWEALRSKDWPFNAEGQDYRDGARRAWRGTLACVSQIDDVFGHILRGLEERGLLEDTIVVYHSDHGCYHTIHGLPEKAPGICSDAVCRVPMIWAGPGVEAGRAPAALAENVDVADTLASLCGLPAMDWTDGTDLAPVLRGDADAAKEVAVTENAWSKAMRWGRWRFVHYPREMFGDDVGELYDMEADPNETTNLYHDPAHQETVTACRRRLFDWLIETTRVATTQPAHEKRTIPGSRRAVGHYRIGADGKVANTEGPTTYAEKGNVNYL